MPVPVNVDADDVRLLPPVRKSSLTVTVTAKTITPRHRADYGEKRWDTAPTNQGGDPATSHDVLTLVTTEENA